MVIVLGLTVWEFEQPCLIIISTMDALYISIFEKRLNETLRRFRHREKFHKNQAKSKRKVVKRAEYTREYSRSTCRRIIVSSNVYLAEKQYFARKANSGQRPNYCCWNHWDRQ